MIGLSQEAPAPRVTGHSARRYAWVVLLVVFLAGIACTMNQFKVPPLFPTLIKSFGIDLAAASLLMSVFAVAGAVLALPSGYILQWLGARTAGAIAIGAVAVGTVIGALAGHFNTLLLGRATEGIGLGLVTVVAPTVIAVWFPPETRGVPMGIWATWVPLGAATMFNIAPAVAGWAGWRAVWWVGAIICGIVLFLYLLFVRMPARIVGDDQSPACAPLHDTDERAAATRRTIWLLAASFFLFNVTVGSLSIFFPTFLVGVRGYTLTAAATAASFQLFAIIGASPIIGVLLNRLRSRKVVLTAAILALACALPFSFVVRTWQIPVLLVFMGCIGAAVPTTIFAAVPEVMGQANLVGKGMAILALGQNLGFVLGPVLFSRLVQTFGWAGAGDFSVPLLLAAAALGWTVRVR